MTPLLDSSLSAATSLWAELLGRELHESAPAPIRHVEGARSLITGAGGYIGNAMARILAHSGASKIVLLDISEQALFQVTSELAALGYANRCIPILGSVCDPALLSALFQEHRPELVIHAAALKHVPLMESNPFAAVATNSLGTALLAQMAELHGARRTILISTDKAVAPHSIMGASKRIAELAMLSPLVTRGAVVRLVNVIGSPCSVAPVFAEQIARGVPLTVTDRRCRRYFLTLMEVAALLAQAINASSATGILVPDPGEPVLIEELARRMISASGRRLPIVFTGLRPGDKLGESLLSERERFEGDATPGLRRIGSPPDVGLEQRLRALESAISSRDLPCLLRTVGEFVPGYTPSPLLRNAASELAPAGL